MSQLPSSDSLNRWLFKSRRFSADRILRLPDHDVIVRKLSRSMHRAAVLRLAGTQSLAHSRSTPPLHFHIADAANVVDRCRALHEAALAIESVEGSTLRCSAHALARFALGSSVGVLPQDLGCAVVVPPTITP
jgi:hypothetical protein